MLIKINMLLYRKIILNPSKFKEIAMNIYIMRHSIAGFNAPNDFSRRLTKEGEQLAHQKGEKLLSLCQKEAFLFDAVLVSPYKRAQETFKIVMQADKILSKNATIQTCEFITPDGKIEPTLLEIEALKVQGVKNLLIVSHLPFVSILTQELSGHLQGFNCADICKLSSENDRFIFEMML